jgi:HK97 family phage portal protein
MATKYETTVISAFGDSKTFSGSIPLNAMTEFITGPHDESSETLINISKAYRCVPWFNRAINLRADSVSYMPFHIETTAGAVVSESPDYNYLMDKLIKLLALTEKSLTKNGVAYWLIERNLVGRKPTPRYIPARSVKPVTTEEAGIVGYDISWSTGTKQYPLDQVVSFVLENDDSEIAPDVSPAQVALEAAGLLYAANAAPARFYSGGFVPVSLVTVPITTTKTDLSKIENFFKRMGTGLRNMFSVLGVYEGVKVETVGHLLKDSITPDITSSARDDIAVAFGVPPTVLDSSSANYATASSEMIGFYVNTVFPECRMIEAAANEQFFESLELRFVFDFELHEIMQSIQLAQADSVVTLTGKPPITLDEGREMLGYEELTTAQQEEMKPPAQIIQQVAPPPDAAAVEDAATVKAIIAEMTATRLQLAKSMRNGQHE